MKYKSLDGPISDEEGAEETRELLDDVLALACQGMDGPTRRKTQRAAYRCVAALGLLLTVAVERGSAGHMLACIKLAAHEKLLAIDPTYTAHRHELGDMQLDK
jgi:hypothetical protein